MTVRCLFDDELNPVTNEIEFLKCDLEDLVQHFKDWGEEIRQYNLYREIAGSLKEVLMSLYPLTTIQTFRYLFVPTKSGWVACFSNCARGGGAGCVSYLSRRIGCVGIRSCYVPHQMGSNKIKRLGGSIFELYDPYKSDPISGYLRWIYATHDAYRWSFDMKGPVQPFEDESLYENRLKKERFSGKVLQNYLCALGIDLFNEDFYTRADQPAVLFDSMRKRHPDVKEIHFGEGYRELMAK